MSSLYVCMYLWPVRWARLSAAVCRSAARSPPGLARRQRTRAAVLMGRSGAGGVWGCGRWGAVLAIMCVCYKGCCLSAVEGPCSWISDGGVASLMGIPLGTWRLGLTVISVAPFLFNTSWASASPFVSNRFFFRMNTFHE